MAQNPTDSELLQACLDGMNASLFALRFDFGLTYPGFKLQKRKLLLRELLASRAIFLDPRQSQQLPQIVIFQFCPAQLFSQLFELNH